MSVHSASFCCEQTELTPDPIRPPSLHPLSLDQMDPLEIEGQYAYVDELDHLESYDWPSQQPQQTACRQIKHAVLVDPKTHSLCLPFASETHPLLLLGHLWPSDRTQAAVKVQAAIIGHLLEVRQDKVSLWVQDHQHVWYKLNRPYGQAYQGIEQQLSALLDAWMQVPEPVIHCSPGTGTAPRTGTMTGMIDLTDTIRACVRVHACMAELTVTPCGVQ